MYLQQSSGLIGIPLAVAGIVLVAAGWRLWRVAVVLSFGILGATAGALLAGQGGPELAYGAIGAVVLGAASYPKAKYSSALLGGIIGAGIFNCIFAGFGLTGGALAIVTAIGLVLFTAVSFLDVRQVIIIITAFEGAVLVVSAAIAFVAEVPGVFNYFRSMATGSSIFVPFLLLVPTVVGTMLQMADANRRADGQIGA